MILYFIFFLFAFLYSMVGLGGGSAYVALLGISGIDHKFIPSTALFLNIIVTSIGFFNYKVHLNFKEKKNFLIFLYLLSISGVFIGSKIHLKRKEFLLILGLSLVIASIISFFRDKMKGNPPDPFSKSPKGDLHQGGNLNVGAVSKPRSVVLILFFGFLFGFLAGLVGIGGGIFLSPILLIAGFPVKEIAGITSLYIFLNSSSGFVSHLVEGNVNFSLILPFTIFVIIGSVLGSSLGSFKFKPIIVKRVLTSIIFIIGIRILWITIS